MCPSLRCAVKQLTGPVSKEVRNKTKNLTREQLLHTFHRVGLAVGCVGLGWAAMKEGWEDLTYGIVGCSAGLSGYRGAFGGETCSA